MPLNVLYANKPSNYHLIVVDLQTALVSFTFALLRSVHTYIRTLFNLEFRVAKDNLVSSSSSSVAA